MRRAIADDRFALHLPMRLYKTKADMYRLSGWFLATHPCSWTRVHRDAHGVLSFVTVVSGYKVWSVLVWKEGYQPSKADWTRRNDLMSAFNITSIEYSETPPWVNEHGVVGWDVFALKREAMEGKRVAHWKIELLGPGTT